MRAEIIVLIAMMAMVTYIPRMLPFALWSSKQLPRFIQGVLGNVPYAALGALIFPAVFLMKEDIFYGLVGAIAAFIVAFTGANVVLVVIASIAALSAYSYIL
nr:AzlD domain-containing protein [Bacillus mediterraneensis]